jgi:NitT/TauT family transport system substrate-binding protein
MKRRILALSLALLALAAPEIGRAETLKVAVPQRGVWDTSFTELGVGQGFFKEQGLDIEVTYTEGGALNEQAVISGSVDIAVSTGFLGIIAAYVKGAPVRIISPEATGAPDFFWYVKAGSPIKSMKDAHGKTVSYSAPGSSSNLVLLALLHQAGVADAKLIPIGAAPNGMPQVMTGQLDISWCAPPTCLTELDDGKIAVVARGNDAPENATETVRVNAVNLNVLQKNRDAIVRFMRAYKKTYEWAYSDPKAIEVYAKLVDLPVPLATRAAREFHTKDSNQIDRIMGIERVLAEALAAKRIPKPMTPDEIKGVFDFVLKPAS